jgi:hypothetical protein
VTVAEADANQTLALLCAIVGVTFVLAVVVLARRS